MRFEVFKKNGFNEVSMGIYEADTPEQAKELAWKDINYGWYVSKAVEPGSLKKYKVKFENPIGEMEVKFMYVRDKSEISKKTIWCREIISIIEIH